MSSQQMGFRPQVASRIAREIKALANKPPEGVIYLESETVGLNEIFATIDGPVDTPFEGGIFKVKLVLGTDFPEAPPRGFFLTKIYHPNIAPNGDICVNTLKRDWTPEVTLSHVLQVIRCLLIVPFPESALNDEAGRLFMDSYEEYASRAKLMTSVHAPKRVLTAVRPSSAVRDKNDDGKAVSPDDQTASKRTKVSKEQKKAKENKKKGLKRL